MITGNQVHEQCWFWRKRSIWSFLIASTSQWQPFSKQTQCSSSCQRSKMVWDYIHGKVKKGIIYDIFLTKYCFSPRQNSIPRYYSFCVNPNWAWLSYWGHWNSGVMNWLHFAKLAEPKVDTIVLYWIIFLTKIMMICDLLFYIG